MPVPIVIDGDNLVKRCIMATAKSDLKAGVWNGGIYNSLTMLSSILYRSEFFAGEIYAAFDQGVPAWRRECVPGYREARHSRKSLLTDSQRKEAYKQVDQVRELLEFLGVVCLSYPDHEGDDVVAAVCRVLIEDYREKPLVVSSDKDLWQLVRCGARVWDIGKNRIVNKAVIKEETGVEACMYLLYKTLIGDTSDSVPGVPGCGPKKAAELIARNREELVAAVMEEPINPDFVILRRLVSILKADRDDGVQMYKYEEALIDDPVLTQQSMRAVALWDSFSWSEHGDDLRARLQEWPEIQKMPFLRRCNRYNLGGVLGAPDRFIQPFQRAFERKVKAGSGV